MALIESMTVAELSVQSRISKCGHKEWVQYAVICVQTKRGVLK